MNRYDVLDTISVILMLSVGVSLTYTTFTSNIDPRYPQDEARARLLSLNFPIWIAIFVCLLSLTLKRSMPKPKETGSVRAASMCRTVFQQGLYQTTRQVLHKKIGSVM